MLSDTIANIRYRLGMYDKYDLVRAINPEREAIISAYPDEYNGHIRSLSDQLMSLDVASDPTKFFDIKHKLELVLDSASKYVTDSAKSGDIQSQKSAQFLGSADMLGYHPAGARLWKFFINPLSVFTFVGDNHWATRAAIKIIRTEIDNEGMRYRYHSSVTPERLAQVDKILKELDLEQYRLNLATQYVVYANSWTLIEKNGLQETVKLSLLQPDGMWPIFDKDNAELTGWEYHVGRKTYMYGLNDIYHLKDYSLRTKYLGFPCLSPAMSDIEADLAASALNNVIMQKAGMIGWIIALEDPSEKNPLALKNIDKMQAKLQKTIQSQYSGVRGAQSIMVANYIKSVHKLTDIGSFEGNFMKLRTEIAKMVAVLLQVPPDRLHIPKADNQIYQAAGTEDLINAQFDKAINSITKKVDAFINEKILKETLNIYDVEITSAGRFSSGNLNGARAALAATQCGPLFDVNELRMWFFKVPPCGPGDSRGRVVCDNSTVRDPNLNPPGKSKTDPREDMQAGHITDEDLEPPSDKT